MDDRMVQIRISEKNRQKLKVVASQNEKSLQEEADIAIGFYIRNRNKI